MFGEALRLWDISMPALATCRCMLSSKQSTAVLRRKVESREMHYARQRATEGADHGLQVQVLLRELRSRCRG